MMWSLYRKLLKDLRNNEVLMNRIIDKVISIGTYIENLKNF